MKRREKDCSEYNELHLERAYTVEPSRFDFVPTLFTPHSWTGINASKRGLAVLTMQFAGRWQNASADSMS